MHKKCFHLNSFIFIWNPFILKWAAIHISRTSIVYFELRLFYFDVFFVLIWASLVLIWTSVILRVTRWSSDQIAGFWVSWGPETEYEAYYHVSCLKCLLTLLNVKQSHWSSMPWGNFYGYGGIVPFLDPTRHKNSIKIPTHNNTPFCSELYGLNGGARAARRFFLSLNNMTLSF